MRLVRKHRLATRWSHWLNFAFLTVMAWSGLLIYWANDVYGVELGGREFVHFFPERFYELLEIDHRLAEGMALHFVFMWLFALNGLLYVAYTLFSGEWRALVPRRHALRDALHVALHDLHLRETLPPQGKYNAAQQLAYTGVVLMGAGSLVTGLAIYRPIQLGALTRVLGGYEAARLEHFALTMGYVLFFVVHVAQVARAGWRNFRGMVAGYDVAEDDAAEEQVR